MYPGIFAGFPKALQLRQQDLEENKYESSSLTQKQKEKYLSLLLDHMDKQKPFLRQELTLSELAQALDINAKYLSQVINELTKKNFMDFINGYRIEEAKKLFNSSRHQHFTIVAIAQEVGFKSRSAFYSAFKKVTGQTPTEFKRVRKLED